MRAHGAVRLCSIKAFATRRESVSFQRPERSVTEVGSMRETRLPPHATGASAMAAIRPIRISVWGREVDTRDMSPPDFGGLRGRFYTGRRIRVRGRRPLRFLAVAKTSDTGPV